LNEASDLASFYIEPIRTHTCVVSLKIPDLLGIEGRGFDALLILMRGIMAHQ
jgi:hypothetical protein